jgi:hypothetical protein
MVVLEMHCTPTGYQWAPLGPDHTLPQGIIVTGSGTLVIVQTPLLKRKQWSQILETPVKNYYLIKPEWLVKAKERGSVQGMTAV